MRRAAAILALADLATIAETDRNFVPQWEALNAFAPDDPSLAALRESARTGVPTQAQLAERFTGAARDALAAEDASVPRGFVARLWNNMVKLVSIRRIGDVAGESSESHLARAQYALERGTFSDAAAEVAALQGPAAQTMAPWLGDARARLALDASLSEVRA